MTIFDFFFFQKSPMLMLLPLQIGKNGNKKNKIKWST